MRALVHRVGLVLCLLIGAASPVHADSASPWTAGPNAVGDDTYSGFIDTPVSGSSLLPNASVVVQGWVVDRSASGWSGIDAVEVYLGFRDQAGTLMNRATMGLPRDDVAAALSNPYWASSGFSVSFSAAGLGVGPNLLIVYAHTPDKGWWYKQLQVVVPAAPPRGFADDPLLIVREATPSLNVPQSTATLTLSGYAIDRNMPESVQLGAGGSGVSDVQAYLDGPRNAGNGQGTLISNATMAQQNREATGFGERFLNSGWEITIHPSDLTVDRHELFIYADSAFWPSETLVIVPFTVH
jgi:hypothetical protein